VITTQPMIGRLKRRGSPIQANPAGAQPRSTDLPNRGCWPGLTAASTGTPSKPEEPAPNMNDDSTQI
jgi:hypothetical protein